MASYALRSMPFSSSGVANKRGHGRFCWDEPEVAEACNRLIKNCIICWNDLYLSHRLAKTTNSNPLSR
jgi:hypothetical protein